MSGQLLFSQQQTTFHATAGPLATVTQAYASPIAAGSLLLCYVNWGGWPNGTSVSGVTDNSSGGTNTWLSLPQLDNPGYELGQIWYCLSSVAAASAPTVTVAFTGNGGAAYPEISVLAFYNTAGFTAALDQYTGAIGTGTALASGYTGTLAQPNELVIGYGGDYAQLNFTVGAGYTAVTPVNAVVGSVEQIFPSNTVPVQSTWTISASNPWLAGTVTFSTAPKPSSISPTSEARGFTGNVTVTGTDFGTGSGESTLTFSGTGITVNSYSVQTSTTITANITIAPNATLSARDVTVTNTGTGNLQTGTLAAAFTVTAAIPPTAINLLTNAAVAVSAGSTIVNTGSTVLHGALDLSPGSVVSGFPPGTIIGATHIGDATAVQSQLDVTTAYNQAAATAGALTIASALDAVTLYTGVYTSGAGTFSLSGGTLTLDAQGDPNAVWIFQMATTLITSAGSVVQVINGGQASNVFWQVGSSATIGATNTFVGTILASASITVTSSGTTIAGGLLANAAVNLGDVIVTVTNTLPPPNPVSIAPTSDKQGYTGNVTVTGTDFDAGGTSTLSFSGTGITVNSYGTRDATTLVANITIGITAALTARDVIVTNADTQTGTLAAGFTITSGAPAPATVAPTTVQQCGTFDVVIAGSNFTPLVTQNFIAFGSNQNVTTVSGGTPAPDAGSDYLAVSHGISVGGNGSATFSWGAPVTWDAVIAEFDGPTPTYVQSDSTVTYSSTSLSRTLTNTVGNTLILYAKFFFGTSEMTIADTQGNVWLPVFDSLDSFPNRIKAWYVPSAKAGVNTVTVSFPNGVVAIGFIEYTPLGNLTQVSGVASGAGDPAVTPALTGPSTLSFSGTGITINSYSVQNATTITANITVDCAATLGLRTVTVTNGNGETGAIGGGGGLIIAEPLSATGPFVSYVSTSIFNRTRTITIKGPHENK